MGCSGSTPAGADPSHVKPEVGTADSFSKKATQQQPPQQRKASLVAVRREGYSSGKTTTGAPSASNEMISGTTIKTANDLDGLRKACSAIVLFSTMTTEQQEAIFAAMFEVREARSRPTRAHFYYFISARTRRRRRASFSLTHASSLTHARCLPPPLPLLHTGEMHT